MKSKLLTLEESNQMLPLLRSIVMDIRNCWNMIIAKRAELESLEKGPASQELGAEERARQIEEIKAELNALIERINFYIREVEDLGCFVEEFKRGVVNFPSLYNGRKIFLCWSLGDDGVTHWHELDESFNERVKIQDTSQFLSAHSQRPKIRS